MTSSLSDNLPPWFDKLTTNGAIPAYAGITQDFVPWTLPSGWVGGQTFCAKSAQGYQLSLEKKAPGRVPGGNLIATCAEVSYRRRCSAKRTAWYQELATIQPVGSMPNWC